MNNTLDHKLCPFCKKSQIYPINLRCEHYPCYDCAKVNLQEQKDNHNLQIKYKLTCPACNKKTVIYDIKSLIVNSHDKKDVNQQFYISSKYLQKSKENAFKIKYKSHSRNNSNSQIFETKYYEVHQQFKGYKTKGHNLNSVNNSISLNVSIQKNGKKLSLKESPDLNKQNLQTFQKQKSKQYSNESESFSSKQDEPKIVCQSHKHKIKYFCYDCNKNYQQIKRKNRENDKKNQIYGTQKNNFALLCQKCNQNHCSYHHILTLKQSIEYVHEQNTRNWSQINKYKSELKVQSQELSQTKQLIVSGFKKLQKEIGQFFQKFRSQIDQAQKQFKQSIKLSYSQSVKYLNSNIQMLKKAKEQIQSIQQISKKLDKNQQISEHISLYKRFCLIETSFQQLHTSIYRKKINLPQLSTINLNDIKNVINKIVNLNVNANQPKSSLFKQNSILNLNQTPQSTSYDKSSKNSHKKVNSSLNIKQNSRKNSDLIIFQQQEYRRQIQKPIMVQVNLKKLAL